MKNFWKLIGILALAVATAGCKKTDAGPIVSRPGFIDVALLDMNARVRAYYVGDKWYGRLTQDPVFEGLEVYYVPESAKIVHVYEGAQVFYHELPEGEEINSAGHERRKGERL